MNFRPLSTFSRRILVVLSAAFVSAKEALPKANRVVVEGLNIIKRHTKARGPGKPSGIIEREAPLQASNVMLICPRCGVAARTGQRFLEEIDHKGRQQKVRFCKVCDEVVDE